MMKEHVVITVSVALLCSLIISLTVGQVTDTRVNIVLPKGDTPILGAELYQLDCTLYNFEPNQYRSVVWFLNGDIITWGEDIVLDYARGHMSLQERNSNGYLQSVLTITSVYLTDTGKYQCSIVEGELPNYLIKASTMKSVFVNDMIQHSQYYFPSAPWPICYPTVETTVFLNTDITIGCFSGKGDPPVDVKLFVSPSGLNDGQHVALQEGYLIDRHFAWERENTLTVTPNHSNVRYLCQIANPRDSMESRTCIIGPIKIGLIEQKIVHVPIGADAFFQCRKPMGTTIMWSTEPKIPTSRMENTSFSTSSIITIKSIQAEENNTVVTCRIDEYDLMDSGKIIVFADENTNPLETPTWLTQPAESTHLLTQLIESPTWSIYTSNMPIEENENRNINPGILAGIGVGAALITIVTTILIVCLLYRTRKYKIAFLRYRFSTSDPISHPRQDPDSMDHGSNHESSTDILSSYVIPVSSATVGTEEGDHETSSRKDSTLYRIVKLIADYHSDPPDIPAPPPPMESEDNETYSRPQASRKLKSSPSHATPIEYSAPKPSDRATSDYNVPYNQRPSQTSSKSTMASYKTPMGSTPPGAVAYKVPQVSGKHSLQDELNQNSAFLSKRKVNLSDHAADTLQYATVHPDPDNPTVKSGRRFDDSPDGGSRSCSLTSSEDERASTFSSPQYATVHPDQQSPRKDTDKTYDSPKGNLTRELDGMPETQDASEVTSTQYATVHPDPKNPIVRGTLKRLNKNSV